MCRHSMVVHKVECNRTGKIYIGNTQQHLKTRMQQHFADVRRLVLNGEKSDSYARHFASLVTDGQAPTPATQRKNITCSIIWQGNPISVVKTFGTRNCGLCSRERIEILKQSRKNPDILINSYNEIYGACRHNPKFHRFEEHPTSTDESPEDERVPHTKVTTEVQII